MKHIEGNEWRNKPFDANSNLDERQLKLVELLLNGEKTKGEIAEILGVHRNTITNWCKDDRVKAIVAEHEAEKIRQANSFYIDKAPIAAKRLWDMAEKSSDKRVAKEIYFYVVNRALGMPSKNVQIADNRDNQSDYDIGAALERMEDDVTPKALFKLEKTGT